MYRRQFLSLAGALGTAGAGCLRAGRQADGTLDPPASIDGAWPLPEYDSGQTNYTSETSGLGDPVSELWRVDSHGEPSALAIAAETVFVAGDKRVRALDARDGTGQWGTSVGSDVTVAGVAGTHVFVRGDGTVVALNRDDGTERWQTAVSALADTVVTTDGTYVLALSKTTPVVTALGLEGGEQRWRVELDVNADRGGILADDERVIVWTAGDVSRWWLLNSDTGEISAERGGGSHPWIPHAYRDGVAYRVDGFYGTVFASGRDGNAWRRELDAYNSGSALPLAAGPDRLYVHLDAGNTPGLYALDVTDGSQLWHTDTGGLVTPAVESKSVKLVACEESLLVATAKALRCLDPTDGTDRWSVERGGIDWLGAVDDLIYTLRDGDIVALRPG